ncbi:MAG TPA: glycosyltransferase family 39 protein [Victivallales bacterium]|nr:glycosyltransferase family 39 protein [Victivallales bacterium]
MFKKNKNLYAIATLLGLLSLIALMRLRTYHEPIDRDIGIYAVAANEIIHGKILYKDVWDTKPPGIFLTYVLGQLIAGFGEFQIYFLNVAGASFVMFGIFFSAKACSGSTRVGLLSATLWVLVSGDILTQANQPNSELFINAALSWGFYFTILSLRYLRIRFFLLAGISYGIASIYKQFAIVPLLMMFIPGLVSGEKPRARTLTGLFISLAGVLCCWLPLFIYFFYVGGLNDFAYMNFKYPFYYIGVDSEQISTARKIIFVYKNFHVLFIKSAWTILPLILASFAGFIIGMRSDRKTWLEWLAFFLSAPLMIILPWKFYPHYYQLLIPSICIGAGWAISEMRILESSNAKDKMRETGKITLIFAVLIFSSIAIIQIPKYSMPPDWWSHKKYGPIFIYCRQIGLEIGEKLKEDETFFQWGYEASLYFYAQRRPGSGRFFNAPFLFGEKKDELTEKTIKEFKASPPALIVLPRKYSQNHPLIIWILENYVPAYDPINRKRTEDEMFNMSRQLCIEDPPYAAQNPPTPPMYYYAPKVKGD